MKNRVPEAFGSNAIRYGFRSPDANVSWQRIPGPVRPVTLQRAVPVPWQGLDGGISPLGMIRRIFAQRTAWSREHGLIPPSPIAMYRKPSFPNWRSPALCTPVTEDMLSTRTVSLDGSITFPGGSTNRDTRLTGVDGPDVGQTPNFLNV